MPRTVFVMIGWVLFGWLVMGSFLALVVDIVAGALGAPDDVRSIFVGMSVLVGVIAGALVGRGQVKRRARAAEPPVRVLSYKPEPPRSFVSPAPPADEAPTDSAPPRVAAGRGVDQMARLLDLYAEGAISRAEFDAARSRLGGDVVDTVDEPE